MTDLYDQLGRAEEIISRLIDQLEGDTMNKGLDIQGPPPGAGTAPGFAAHDLLKYLPVIIQIGEAVLAGQGSFSTWTPMGKRWVTVSDKPPTP